MWKHPETHWARVDVTIVDHEVALKDWRLRCGYEPRLVHDPLMVQTVPKAYRILKLIYAEVQNHRIAETKCKVCLEPHFDWFDINCEPLLAVSNRWKIWMNLQPSGDKREFNEFWNSALSDVSLLDALKQFRQWARYHDEA